MLSRKTRGGAELLDRQELLSWLNGLLQLNITKVEQCGTGYVPRTILPGKADH